MLAGVLHLEVTKVKLPKKGPAPPTCVMWRLFPLAVWGGAQGAAPLWKPNQPIKHGGVMEGGKSGFLEECLGLDPAMFATVPRFPPSLGGCFHLNPCAGSLLLV